MTPDHTCAECSTLRAQVRELQGILIDNTHALRTVLHGESSAMPCTPKEAWERTLDELRERLRHTCAECRRERGVAG